jgi:hypothetical protein
MDRLKKIINIVHDENNVYEFQKCCGVERLEVKSKENGEKTIANGEKSKIDANVVRYRINNQILYRLFQLASFIGTEEFYAILFPFFFWNLDPQTGKES